MDSYNQFLWEKFKNGHSKIKKHCLIKDSERHFIVRYNRCFGIDYMEKYFVKYWDMVSDYFTA